MLEGQGDPAAILKAKGLEQTVSDDEISAMVDDVLVANAQKVEEYRAGKVALMGYFVGLVMRSAKGKASPTRIKAMLEEKLQA
jgi:aspartyl-tRNA(Asn)/glutamyl-tRNA(Gln) amidotransferase subunit B